MDRAVTFITTVLGLVILLSTPPASQATGNHGVLIDVSMRVTEHVNQSPAFAYPASSSRICEPSLGDYPRAMAKLVSRQSGRKECTSTRYRENAGVITFALTCTRPTPTIVRGVFHMIGDSSFVGDIRTSYAAAGRPVTVDAKYTGKRVGTCHYPQPTR